MEGLENPFVLSIIGVILTAVILTLTLESRHKIKGSVYNEHVKNKVNQIYDEVTNNGQNLAEPDFFGMINEYRPEILEHLFTYQKDTGILMYDVFWEIYKLRSERDKEKEKEKLS